MHAMAVEAPCRLASIVRTRHMRRRCRPETENGQADKRTGAETGSLGKRLTPRCLRWRRTLDPGLTGKVGAEGRRGRASASSGLGSGTLSEAPMGAEGVRS